MRGAPQLHCLGRPAVTAREQEPAGRVEKPLGVPDRFVDAVCQLAGDEREGLAVGGTERKYCPRYELGYRDTLATHARNDARNTEDGAVVPKFESNSPHGVDRA